MLVMDLEYCVDLVNKSRDKQNMLISRYGELIGKLLYQSPHDNKLTPFYLHIDFESINSKVATFTTNRGLTETQAIENGLEVARRIVLTTSNEDPEESLEDFLNHLCTKILPDFTREGNVGLLPHYLYV